MNYRTNWGASTERVAETMQQHLRTVGESMVPAMRNLISATARMAPHLSLLAIEAIVESMPGVRRCSARWGEIVGDQATVAVDVEGGVESDIWAELHRAPAFHVEWSLTVTRAPWWWRAWAWLKERVC